MYVYGPSGDTAAEGTWVSCCNLKKLTRWHREGFSFLPTGLKAQGRRIRPDRDRAPLYMETGVAYHRRAGDSHHPLLAIHDRDGSTRSHAGVDGLSDGLQSVTLKPD